MRYLWALILKCLKLPHSVEKIYITKWYPKPNDQDIISMLGGLPFRNFIEYCQQKATLLMLAQVDKEKRNEFAYILEGVYNVESWAKNWIEEYSEKRNEEKNKDLNFDLSDISGLASEYDKRVGNGNVY